MDFSPHHRFRQCRRFERVVKRLEDDGAVDAQVLEDFRTYHYSLIYKLRSALYHVDTLTSYLGSKGTTESATDDVVYRVNFHFDGFCYAVGSALDIFAREVLSYMGIAHPARVYFSTAREQILANRAGDPFLPRVDEPTWLPEFKDYRNTTTHENTIGNHFTIEVNYHGGDETRRMVFPLPDDPRASFKDRTYTKNRDVSKYVADTFSRTLRFLNPAYRDLIERMETHGALPL